MVEGGLLLRLWVLRRVGGRLAGWKGGIEGSLSGEGGWKVWDCGEDGWSERSAIETGGRYKERMGSGWRGEEVDVRCGGLLGEDLRRWY